MGLGAVVAPALYACGGIAMAGGVAAAAAALAAIVLWLGSRPGATGTG